MARRRGHRRWAVEGCRGAGRSLARRLAADGELVPGVPAKLAARVRVYCRGHGRRGELSALRTRAVRRPRRLLAGLAPGERIARGRTSIPAGPPEGVRAFVVLDWKDDRLVGTGVPGASTRLHPDLLDEAEILS